MTGIYFSPKLYFGDKRWAYALAIDGGMEAIPYLIGGATGGMAGIPADPAVAFLQGTLILSIWPELGVLEKGIAFGGQMFEGGIPGIPTDLVVPTASLVHWYITHNK